VISHSSTVDVFSSMRYLILYVVIFQRGLGIDLHVRTGSPQKAGTSPHNAMKPDGTDRNGQRGLGHLNNLINIYQAAPALTSITSNFTSHKPPDKSKSSCQPPSPQDRAEQIRKGTRPE